MVTPSVVPIFAGSSPNLTCIVELSPLVDVPVTVSTAWTGPAGFTTTTIAQPVMGTTTNYTSAVVVASIGSSQSGNFMHSDCWDSILILYRQCRILSNIKITVGMINYSYDIIIL